MTGKYHKRTNNTAGGGAAALATPIVITYNFIDVIIMDKYKTDAHNYCCNPFIHEFLCFNKNHHIYLFGLFVVIIYSYSHFIAISFKIWMMKHL